MERNLSYVNPYRKNLWFSLGSSCLLMFSRTTHFMWLLDVPSLLPSGVYTGILKKGFRLQLSDCYIRIVYIV